MDAVSTGAVAETPDEIRAMDLNLMVLCGRLVSEPETRRFDTGATQLRMLVAVGSPIPSPRFDVLPVVYWKPPASLLDGSLRADTRVWISGTVRRLSTDAGTSRRLEIVASSMSARRPDGEVVHV